LPDLFIGKLSGPAALGTYTIAYEVSNLPTTELVWPIGRAVFPGYSLMAQDLNELRRGFMDVLAVILLVTVPAGIGMFVLAESIVYGVLGSKWYAAIPLIQALSIFGIIRAANSNTGSVYLALGQPRLIAYLTLFFLAISVPSLILLVPSHGAGGAAIAMILAAAAQTPIGYAIVMRKVGLRFGALASVVWRPVLAAVLMGWAVFTLQNGWGRPETGSDYEFLLQLLVLVPIGAGLYLLIALSLWLLSGRPRGGESIVLGIIQSRIRRLVT
jgi:O-antigen/teichoic acid export membrane protein